MIIPEYRVLGFSWDDFEEICGCSIDADKGVVYFYTGDSYEEVIVKIKTRLNISQDIEIFCNDGGQDFPFDIGILIK